MQPINTIMKALRNIGAINAQFPYIYTGDELRVVDHINAGHGRMLYKMQTHNNLVVLVDPEDVALPIPNPELTIEQQIQEAFREGYSRGHSRGQNMARHYGGDDQYSIIIQVATQNYLQELKDESGV